jgi:UDP-3-O-[3-hydroxymyristoyl] glucosamine N-acyltransferase
MTNDNTGKTVEALADLIGGRCRGDGETLISSVASLDAARQTDISFFDAARSSAPPESGAGCLLVTEEFAHPFRSLIVVANPKLAFAKIAAVLRPGSKPPPGIHPAAIVSSSASIADDVSVGPQAFVGSDSTLGPRTQLRSGVRVADGVSIGADCILHANVVVEEGSAIGNNVILHAGVVIGADGFGYVRDSDSYIKFPQIGTVVIEDDVEIGANSCVDRGALGETRIGRGTKIDNLVQIAHNVQIGERVIIAAQTGISGSTVIESDAVIGGQVGMGDHARIMSGAIIGSQAGVLPGKIVRPGVWWGTPVQPLADYKKQNAHLKGIARLKEEVREMKRLLEKLQEKL